MANVYTNYKAKLSTNALTTVYTVSSETTAIIKSIRVSNEDTENDCNVSLFLVDTNSVSSVSYTHLTLPTIYSV